MKLNYTKNDVQFMGGNAVYNPVRQARLEADWLLLHARIVELEAVVARLPVTADGVSVVPGMMLYHPQYGDCTTSSIRMNCAGDDDPSNCYSTEHAARTAATKETPDE